MKIPFNKLPHVAVCLAATFLVGLASPFAGAMLGMGLGIGNECGCTSSTGNKLDWLNILDDATGVFVGMNIANIVRLACKLVSLSSH